MNKEFANKAITYKRTVAGTYMLVDGTKMMEKVTGEDFCMTKKLDGAMTVLFYSNGAVEAYSSNGNERPELPCTKEFGELCKSAGLKSATIAAELYATLSDTGRERVGDVATALADTKLQEKLHLAPFDILDLDDTPFKAEHYKETLAKLNELFSGALVKPVEAKHGDKGALQEAYTEWVENGGAEGLVVHNETPIVYKLKPRHTIDCAIIGYTLGEDEHAGGIRDIMVAVMTPEGQLHQFTTLGNGLTVSQRVEMLQKLEPLACISEYIETDSRGVAYQMVRPEIVAEISVIDLVSENSKGEAKMDMLLNYTAEAGYTVAARTPGVSAHSPVFERIRDDKSVNAADIRISQLTDLCPFSNQKPVVMTGLPKSEMIFRKIYTKGADLKFMIQKYVIWKTNKEQTGAFPAYVLHYTDYSVSRKEPLKRDIRVSNSKDQILQLCDEMIKSNVKKGWAEKV